MVYAAVTQAVRAASMCEPLLCMDCRVKPGNDDSRDCVNHLAALHAGKDKQRWSRDAFASELCRKAFTKRPPQEGRRSAERRIQPMSARRRQDVAARRRVGRGAPALRSPACGGRLGGGSPSGAPPRRSPKRPNAPAQPRPRFTRAGGRRRYPHRRSRLSGAPRAPVVVPEGTMPGRPRLAIPAESKIFRASNQQVNAYEWTYAFLQGNI